MPDRPQIKAGDWIRIGQTPCVVATVRGAGDQFGDCEVVFNSAKPTNRDARWDGEKWEFIETGDFGGYADKYPRLRTFVEILKRGQYP